jgi:hypothetical protein
MSQLDITRKLLGITDPRFTIKLATIVTERRR